LGNVYQHQGNKKKAQEFFEKAVKLNSPHADTYAKLATIYRSQGRAEEANKLLKKAMAIKQGSN